MDQDHVRASLRARPTQGLGFAEAGNQGFSAGDDEEIPVRSGRDGGLADHNGVGAGPLIFRDSVNDTNRIAIARINVRDDRQLVRPAIARSMSRCYVIEMMLMSCSP